MKDLNKEFDFWVKIIKEYKKDNTYVRPKIIWNSNNTSFNVEIIKEGLIIWNSSINYFTKFCKKNKISFDFILIDERHYKVRFEK